MNFFKACSYYCEDCYSDDVAPQKYAKRSAKIESEIEAYWCVKKFSTKTQDVGILKLNKNRKLLVYFFYALIVFMVYVNDNFLLHQWKRGNLIPTILFICILIYSLYTFEALRNADPGFIPKNNLIFENIDPGTFLDIPAIEAFRKSKKNEETIISSIKIPNRSKYCKRCENYVAKFDHHCLKFF
jgi:hypothetical protein